MIAVVSSTVAPSALHSHDGARTTLSPEVRLEHTKNTIASLLAFGVSQILIADNSVGGWLEGREADLAPAKVFHFRQPPVKNKGIGELWLLLGILDHLPPDEPILKISGRYTVGKDSQLSLDGADVCAKLYQRGRIKEISTRCYLMKNRDVAARVWEKSLDELYAAQSRIVGPRSLLRFLKVSLSPAKDMFRYGDPPGSVEIATYKAIEYMGLSLKPVEYLDVQGILGSWINPEVKE